MPKPETDQWNSRSFAWTRDEKKVLPAFREHLRGYDSKLANAVADDPRGIRPGRFDARDTRALEAMIKKDYGKKKAIPYQKILYKLIRTLNRKDELCIPLPTSHRLEGQETSIFRRDNA